METLLFTYGTLRVGMANAGLLEYDGKYEKTATSVDKFIMITTRGRGFPYLIDCADVTPAIAEKYATYIYGDVYSVTPRGVALCDKLEGHPDWYTRRSIMVKDADLNMFEAQVYILNSKHAAECDFSAFVFLDGDWKNRYLE
jgi:gamma-glutamylcyclotransferase (GGCT)/AIG2-like uncharacterized protein YtfP